MKDELDDIVFDIDINNDQEVSPKSKKTKDTNPIAVEDKPAVEPKSAVVEDEPPVEIDSEKLVSKGEKALIVEEIKAEKPAIILDGGKKKSKYLPVLIILLVAVILGAVFWIFKDDITGMLIKPVDQTESPVVSEKPAEFVETDPEVKKFIQPTTGETWLSTPKDISAQGWLAVEQLSYYQDIGVGTSYFKSAKDQMSEAVPVYKEIGARAGNAIIFVYSPSEGVSGSYYLFEKRTDGTIALVTHSQESGYYNAEILANFKASVIDSVLMDESTRYDSLNVPSKIRIDEDDYVLRPDYLWIADGWIMAGSKSEGMKSTLVRKLGGSSLYRTETKYSDTNLTNIGYYIELPIGTRVGVKYEPNQASLEGYSFDNEVSLQYRGGSGRMEYDSLMAIARGCGGNLSAITRSDSLKESDLMKVGKTNTGAAIYEPKDKNIELYKKAYEEYKLMYGDSAVSLEDYLKNHGLVILKGKKGEILVYVRGQYAPVGGCAKPVVYLYPEADTLVDVRVGANVTVSDPLYPETGWRNVLARPTGELTYKGQRYESLFWEGQGFGQYPGIVSGTVVKRADAETTIRRQLSEQGLNAKESADFMEFWADKIPNKPYVRLTWLDTRQMDDLAPLHISPRPDTVIRVFLDMDGFDNPPKLAPQKLSAIPRKGFTVVEWGGLTTEFRR